jgi:hypothetical protein
VEEQVQVDHAGSRRMVVVALVVGLVLGLGAAWLLGRSDAGGDGGATAAAATPAAGASAGDEADLAASLPDPDPLVDIAEATTAEAGLRGFLAAEAAGDWEASWAFLTPAQQEVAYPTAARYRVDEVVVDEAAGTATARTLTAFDPVIDPVLGLVAARGRTAWSLERAEDGTWRVDPSGTVNTPLYPEPAAAVDAARRWVDARVACEDAGDLEAGSVVGSPALADGLCAEDQPAVVDLGPVGALADSAAASALLSRYGPEVFGWAATVPVAAATPFTAVLGPLGDDWVVVGVLPG